jgi:hypothetical protein
MNKLILISVLVFVCSCGVESGSGGNRSFSYVLSMTCQSSGNATQCIQANNGAKVYAYAVLETCNNLFGAAPDSTEVSNAISDKVAIGSGTVLCTSSVCTHQIETWSNVTQEGTLTLFVIIDVDSDGNIGESGDVFACEDGMPFNNGGSDIITEDSATLGYMDVQ